MKRLKEFCVFDSSLSYQFRSLFEGMDVPWLRFLVFVDICGMTGAGDDKKVAQTVRTDRQLQKCVGERSTRQSESAGKGNTAVGYLPGISRLGFGARRGGAGEGQQAVLGGDDYGVAHHDG